MPSPTNLPVPAPLADAARLDCKEVCAVLKCSRSWLYREMAAGRFPQPIKQGPRYSRWPVAVVRDYLSAHAA